MMRELLLISHFAALKSLYVLIADVGEALFGGLDLVIHKGTEFFSPTFYLPTGFAVPASIGVQLANSKIIPIVPVGDGALQMTGAELSTIAHENLNPIVIILNTMDIEQRGQFWTEVLMMYMSGTTLT